MCYQYIKDKQSLTEDKEQKKQGVRFYDALTASGLRALRFRKEIPEEMIEKVVGCDLSDQAINIFHKNIELNELVGDPKIQVVLNDTNKFMCNLADEEAFDIIDLDPYGSMVPFLYQTISSLKKTGLLCVTCTDSRVLCGVDKHKCFYLYGSARGGSDTFREMGLRVMV